MKNLKGFISVKDLTNNNPSVVSEFGELSTWSRTYAKDITEYENDKGYTLHVFRYNLTSDKTQLKVDTNFAMTVITVVEQLRAKLSAYSELETVDYLSIKNQILTDFTLKISGFNFGKLSIDENGNVLPEWVSWESVEIGYEANVRIWLKDEAFQDQYDEYEITVVPPITDLNALFNSWGSVKDVVTAITPTIMMQNIQEAKDSKPETYIRTLSLPLVNSVNQDSFMTTWSVLIYGKQGDNVDAIKDSIMLYVEVNSDHTQLEWQALIPEIYARTEMLIMPFWDKFAITNKSIMTGINSSVFNVKEALDTLVSRVSFYTEEHIRNNVILTNTLHMNLGIALIMGPNNIESKKDFFKLYPDYIPVPTSSLDFNRMYSSTKSFIILLLEMLAVAETIDEFTVVDKKYRKVKRAKKLYLATTFEDVQILVSIKDNLK